MPIQTTPSPPVSFVDEANSTTATLSGAGTWTGSWVDASRYDSVVFFMDSDVDGTLTAEFSPDGTNADLALAYEFDASAVNPPNRLTIIDRYYRLRYTNGSSAQGHFRLQSVLKTSAQLLSTPLNIAVPKDADAIVARVIAAELSMAEGKYAGYEIINKFGRNEDVDTATVPETIWRGGGLYTGHPVSTSETVDVFSASANDTSAGTGARTVQIVGLDANWNQQEEAITMNGTSQVTSSGTYRRVFRAYVLTAGSGGTNAGQITVRHTTTTANVFAQMPAGENQTQTLAYTVPANHIGLIRRCEVQIDRSNTATATCRIRTRPSGGVYRDRDVFSISEAGPYSTEFFGGIHCTEKSDIRVDVTACSANNTTVTGRLDIIIVEQ